LTFHFLSTPFVNNRKGWEGRYGKAPARVTCKKTF
jgi:hypothetical protein